MPDATARPAIAVFGGSDVAPDSPEYRLAIEVGRLLADAGCTVINGGYGGVMEASARGARERHGPTIGVTTPVLGRRGGANPFIDTAIEEIDLFDRTRRLIETASGFIVLPGRSGTLAELAMLWALKRAGRLEGKPIVLLGPIWDGLIRALRTLGLVGDDELASTRLAGDPRAAVETARRAPDGAPRRG